MISSLNLGSSLSNRQGVTELMVSACQKLQGLLSGILPCYHVCSQVAQQPLLACIAPSHKQVCVGTRHWWPQHSGGSASTSSLAGSLPIMMTPLPAGAQPCTSQARSHSIMCVPPDLVPDMLSFGLGASYNPRDCCFHLQSSPPLSECHAVYQLAMSAEA